MWLLYFHFLRPVLRIVADYVVAIGYVVGVSGSIRQLTECGSEYYL